MKRAIDGMWLVGGLCYAVACVIVAVLMGGLLVRHCEAASIDEFLVRMRPVAAIRPPMTIRKVPRKRHGIQYEPGEKAFTVNGRFYCCAPSGECMLNLARCDAAWMAWWASR